MITPLDSKVLDINSEYIGIDVSELMENAGKALADVISEMYDGKKILFICGTGNNGGDGFVAARILDADVAVFGRPKTEVALKKMNELPRLPLKYNEDLLKRYDVLVDCVLGTGLKGPVKDPYPDFIRAMNESGKFIIACDVPTGFGSTLTPVKPKITVTFHDIKVGMTEQLCGRIVVKKIGIPDGAFTNVGPGDMLRYPIPGKDAHKGQSGMLLIIGGGPYIGAPAMAGMAALRIGTDLVHIATPESSFIPIASMSPSYIVHKMKGDHIDKAAIESLLPFAEKFDAVLIGPGLGQNDETKVAVIDFIKRCSRPMVIDADAINAVAGLMLKKNVLYTPHRMELKRLIGDNDLERSAERMGCVIVQKGPKDTITDGRMTRYNLTGTPAMTVGGTGDVLAGTIAGLVAKGMSLFDAGCLGTYICGKAGEMAFKEYSFGLTAEDVIDNLGKVLQKEL